MDLKGKVIGYGLTGSHCTLAQTFEPMEALVQMGAEVIPVISSSVQSVQTRFGNPEKWQETIFALTGHKPLTSIAEVEPFGPKKLVDAMVVAPCTGTTMARLANAISDTAVLMGTKATMRNGRPVVLAVTNRMFWVSSI